MLPLYAPGKCVQHLACTEYTKSKIKKSDIVKSVSIAQLKIVKPITIESIVSPEHLVCWPHQQSSEMIQAILLQVPHPIAPQDLVLIRH